MNNQEKIYQALNSAIGEWKPSITQPTIDLTPDDPIPLGEINENKFPAKLLKNHTQYDDVLSSPNKGEVGGILGEAIQRHGFEAIAFYKSFRQKGCKPYYGKWGIFYLEQGLDLLAQLISIQTSDNFHESNKLGLEFLYCHEKYHYLVDVLALGIESPLAKHLYLPFRHAYRNHGSQCVEEALANANAWQWAQKKDKTFPGISSFAKDFMKNQPNAYNRFEEDLDILNAELAANLVDQHFGKFTNFKLATWLRSYPLNISSRFVPEYVIQCSNLSSLFPRVQIYPKVTGIVDTPQVNKKLDKPGSPLKDKWEKTKKKLIICPSLGGLDFKQWPKIPHAWSVRLDQGNRGHLVPKVNSTGIWETVFVGSHDEGDH